MDGNGNRRRINALIVMGIRLLGRLRSGNSMGLTLWFAGPKNPNFSTPLPPLRNLGLCRSHSTAFLRWVVEVYGSSLLLLTSLPCAATTTAARQRQTQYYPLFSPLSSPCLDSYFTPTSSSDPIPHLPMMSEFLQR